MEPYNYTMTEDLDDKFISIELHQMAMTGAKWMWLSVGFTVGMCTMFGLLLIVGYTLP